MTRRPPSSSFRQYLTEDSSWKSKAACGGELTLPWITEGQPTPRQLGAMATICADCPVMKDCANYALHTGNVGAGGGFYAGVWLPWSRETRDNKLLRQQARRALKIVTGEKPKPLRSVPGECL